MLCRAEAFVEVASRPPKLLSRHEHIVLELINLFALHSLYELYSSKGSVARSV